MRHAHLGIALVSVLAVVSIAVVDGRRTSPGPIATVHAQLDDMEGGDSCALCHGGFGTSMSEACLDCHATIEAQFEERDGLHGLLQTEDEQVCSRCHADHHGAGFAVVSVRSFRGSGFEERDAFEHARVGFDMRGEHLELACAECHTNADAHVLREGQLRFLGLEQDCATCHADPHEDDREPGCVQCHGQESFDLLESRDHARVLPLEGGHAELACLECHAEGSPYALDRVSQPSLRLAPRACLDCHDSPHMDAFVERSARVARLTTGASCVTCHAAEHTEFRDERIELSAAEHAFSGFPLADPHDAADCAACHDPEQRDFARRYPGRDADSCEACHDDPHGGQFETGEFAGDGCLSCHARQHFAPNLFDVTLHERTALPLDASHREVDCASCHPAPDHADSELLASPLFREASDQCAACHADAHDGFFDAQTATMPDIAHGDCARCHVPSTFADVAADAFDHGTWTRLDVRGAHDQAGCHACHVLADTPDASGRTFGRVEEHFGTFEGCASCHADPHEGGFDTPALPALVTVRGNENGCERCHVQTSFRTFPEGFEHGAWTGFVLDGKHADASCSACHTPLRRPTDTGRTWKRALGNACADCHASPHAGQFVEDGEANCARCHQSATSFTQLVFRHELDSRFALGEAHRDVDCSRCHVRDDSLVNGDGSGAIRYRPIERSCTSCHGDHDEPIHRPSRRAEKTERR